MTRKDRDKNNILIADFMGGKKHKEVNLWYHFPNHGLFSFFQGKYHDSWDWIMPVYLKAVDEIAPLLEGLTDGNENLIGDCTVDLLNGEIESLQESLVKVIEWYNKNK